MSSSAGTEAIGCSAAPARDDLAGNDGADRLEGEQGGDEIDGGNGNDVLLGGAGRDELQGGAGVDQLVGGQDNDTLDGGVGADRLAGGPGNDRLVFDSQDASISGGSGTDTLRLDGSGVTLDLTQLANDLITSVERIDIDGSGTNTLTLELQDLLDLSGSTDQLIVDGDVGDTVNSTGQGWTLDAGGPVDVDRIMFDSYSLGLANLLIDTDVTQNIS